MYVLQRSDGVPRNKYPEETVKKILDVSLNLFIEKGFEQTTVLDIVDNLGGLTRGAFYHHFKTKDEVLMALIDRGFNEFDPYKEAAKAPAANGLERLKLALKLALKLNIESREHNKLLTMALPLMKSPRFLFEQVKGLSIDAKLMAPLIEEGIADGSIPPGNSKLLSELFMVLVNFWMIPALFPYTEKEYVEKIMFVKQVLHNAGLPIIDDELENMAKETLLSINI